MARSQYIMGRGQTRVELPNSTASGGGFGMSGGSTLYTLTKYNFQGFPLFTPQGLPTGYPAVPPGMLNFNNLIWLAPALTQPGAPGSATGSSANNSATGHVTFPIPYVAAPFGDAFMRSDGTLFYAGPDVLCNCHVVFQASSFNGAGDFEFHVKQDGNPVIDEQLNVSTVIQILDFPFTITATAGSLIQVTVESSGGFVPNKNGYDFNGLATFTPAF